MPGQCCTPVGMSKVLCTVLHSSRPAHTHRNSLHPARLVSGEENSKERHELCPVLSVSVTGSGIIILSLE